MGEHGSLERNGPMLCLYSRNTLKLWMRGAVVMEAVCAIAQSYCTTSAWLMESGGVERGSAGAPSVMRAGSSGRQVSVLRRNGLVSSFRISIPFHGIEKRGLPVGNRGAVGERALPTAATVHVNCRRWQSLAFKEGQTSPASRFLIVIQRLLPCRPARTVKCAECSAAYLK